MLRDFIRTIVRKREWRDVPAVLVLGSTGTGKTSLVRSMLGKVVPEDRIGHGAPTTHTFDRYERGSALIFDSRGFETSGVEADIAEISAFIEQQATHHDFRERIHTIWYAISAPGARVTNLDFSVVSKLHPRVLIAITKADLARTSQLDHLISALTGNAISPDTIIPCSVETRLGVTALLRATKKLTAQGFGEARGWITPHATRNESVVESMAGRFNAAAASDFTPPTNSTWPGTAVEPGRLQSAVAVAASRKVPATIGRTSQSRWRRATIST